MDYKIFAFKCVDDEPVSGSEWMAKIRWQARNKKNQLAWVWSPIVVWGSTEEEVRAKSDSFMQAQLERDRKVAEAGRKGAEASRARAAAAAASKAVAAPVVDVAALRGPPEA